MPAQRPKKPSAPKSARGAMGSGHHARKRFGQHFLSDQGIIGKYFFDTGLGIVKVPGDPHDTGVVPLLGEHLLFLDGADAVLGIVDQNIDPGDISKSS